MKKNLMFIGAIAIPTFIALSLFLRKKKKINPKGKVALFIGDSHTAGCNYGYQTLLSKEYEFTQANLSEIGRTSKWCFDVLSEYLKNYQIPTWMYRTPLCKTNGIGKKPDLCFIYIGNNDALNKSISIETTVNNIQKMVDLCNSKDISPIVIVGFNADDVQVNNPRTKTTIYVTTKEQMWELASRYYNLQKAITKSIKNATVVPTWDEGDFLDALDGIHLTQAAHKRFAEYIGNYLFTK